MGLRARKSLLRITQTSDGFPFRLLRAGHETAMILRWTIVSFRPHLILPTFSWDPGTHNPRNRYLRIVDIFGFLPYMSANESAPDMLSCKEESPDPNFTLFKQNGFLKYLEHPCVWHKIKYLIKRHFPQSVMSTSRLRIRSLYLDNQFPPKENQRVKEKGRRYKELADSSQFSIRDSRSVELLWRFPRITGSTFRLFPLSPGIRSLNHYDIQSLSPFGLRTSDIQSSSDEIPLFNKAFGKNTDSR
jgi:hypothetical protein